MDLQLYYELDGYPASLARKGRREGGGGREGEGRLGGREGVEGGEEGRGRQGGRGREGGGGEGGREATRPPTLRNITSSNVER